MTKKARLASADAQEEEENLEDSFNKFPDDILVNIVSWLTLKEAARTSVLSRRWKYLWRFTSNLHLDEVRRYLIPPSTEQRSKYVCWVNKVLELHRGSDINELRIGFGLRDSHGSDITNWIYTAMAKKVRNFKLDLWPNSSPDYSNFQRWYKRQHRGLGTRDYSFPQEWYNNLKKGLGIPSIKSLRSLHLNAVNVGGEVLEFFIHSCPLLEDLFVGDSSDLLSLKVVGSSIPLKYLDIRFCYAMKEIEISASGLISFKYFGKDINLHVGNVPQLVDVVINGTSMFKLRHIFGSIVGCFPQLKTLVLECCNEVLMKFGHFELPKLIHFELLVTADNHESLLGMIFIMKACPFLQKLVVKHLFSSCSRIRENAFQDRRHAHQHLKLVELHGFDGREVDFEFANIVFEDAAILEKMIVVSFLYACPNVVRDWTNMLKGKLPEGVQLVVRPF